MQEVEVVFLEASYTLAGNVWAMTGDPRNPPEVTIRTDNTGPANPWFSGLPRGSFYFVTDITLLFANTPLAAHDASITSSLTATPDSAPQYADGRLRLNTRDLTANVNLSGNAILRVCLEIDKGRA